MIDHGIFQQGSDDDRFKFDIIKQLAESLREMSTTQTKMLERLARIEEQRTHESVAMLSERVTVLEIDFNKRTGMMNAVSALPKFIAFIVTIASIFSAIYLAGRATGVIQSPPTTVTKIEDPAARQIEQATVGGKP